MTNAKGPVISGSVAVREREISKETDIREIGAICLPCGHRQSKRTGTGVTRDFAPVQWESMKAIDTGHISTAFGEVLNRAT